MESAFRDGIAEGLTLFETFRWEPGTGVLRRPWHVARLSRSAKRLGIEPRGVEDALDRVQGPGPLRVRLDVGLDGAVTVKAVPFLPLPQGTVWHLAFAEARLSATDPWLTVKTSKRVLYDAARADLPDGIDEMVFLNQDGKVCEGTITSVFADLGDGMLTPPLSCGLLPGVLRAELMALGRVREAVLTPEDLRQAQQIWVGNSLRGLIAARL